MGYRIVYAILWPILRLCYPCRYIGRERLPEGAVLICANHSNAVDPILIAFAFGRKKQIHFMAKEELFKNPVFGWLIRSLGAFPVARGKGDTGVIDTAVERLSSGRSLMIFPEGTRVHEGESVEAKTGAALFATRTGTPMLPVYIQPKKRIFRPTTVVIGQPYFPKTEGRRATAEELEEITQDLMNRIRALGEGLE